MTSDDEGATVPVRGWSPPMALECENQPFGLAFSGTPEENGHPVSVFLAVTGEIGGRLRRGRQERDAAATMSGTSRYVQSSPVIVNEGPHFRGGDHLHGTSVSKKARRPSSVTRGFVLGPTFVSARAERCRGSCVRHPPVGWCSGQ